MFLLCPIRSAIIGQCPTLPNASRPEDLADASAFKLRSEGRRRKNDAGEFMARIVAKRLVDHLDRCGFVVMKKPPIGGGTVLGRGFKG